MSLVTGISCLENPIKPNDFNCTDEELYEPISPFCNLPVEIFLHICSFLDGKCLSETLRYVCTRFHDILSDEKLWQLFVNRRIKRGFYPALRSITASEDFTWEKACVQLDQETKIWSQKENNLHTIFLKHAHYSSVDAVLLMHDGATCISGSRDRGLAIWDLAQIFRDEPAPPIPTTLKVNAHLGWVWDLASIDNNLYSCSWDTTIKLWDIETGLQFLHTYQCQRTVLSVVCDARTVAAGLYSSMVLLLDPRMDTALTQQYSAHSQSVLTLAMTDEYVVSGSEDCTYAVWDRRAGKVLAKGLRVANAPRHFPMCLSFTAGCLYIGDSRGNLYLCDPTDFSVKCCYNKWSNQTTEEIIRVVRTTGIKSGYGSIVASFDNGYVSVLTPVEPAREITTFKCAFGQASGMDYRSNVLAVGSESALEVWIPKDNPLFNAVTV